MDTYDPVLRVQCRGRFRIVVAEDGPALAPVRPGAIAVVIDGAYHDSPRGLHRPLARELKVSDQIIDLRGDPVLLCQPFEGGGGDHREDTYDRHDHDQLKESHTLMLLHSMPFHNAGPKTVPLPGKVASSAVRDNNDNCHRLARLFILRARPPV